MTTANVSNTQNTFGNARKNGIFVFMARKEDRVAERVIARDWGRAPRNVSSTTLYEAADYNNLDAQSMALAIATGRINNAIATKHEGYIHFYADIRVVLKYREIISHRNVSIEELEDIIVKDFMDEAQAAVVCNFARAIRAASDAGIIVSFIDWRSISFLEFANPNNVPVLPGAKLAFKKGVCGSLKTYGLQVTGTFEVVPSTRDGEEGRMLLDIRKFGSENNPNSMLAFARGVYRTLQNKLTEGRSLRDLLEDSNAMAESADVVYGADEFDVA